MNLYEVTFFNRETKVPVVANNVEEVLNIISKAFALKGLTITDINVKYTDLVLAKTQDN